MSSAGNCRVPYYFVITSFHSSTHIYSHKKYFHIGIFMLVVTTNVSSHRETPDALQKAKRNPFSSQYASLEEQHISLRIQCTFADTYRRQTTPLCFVTVAFCDCISPAVILPLPWTETPTLESHGEQQRYKETWWSHGFGLATQK